MKVIDQLAWANQHPYSAAVVGAGAVVATCVVAVMAVLFFLDDEENRDGDQRAADAGLPRDDLELNGYYRRIGDGIHWRTK